MSESTKKILIVDDDEFLLEMYALKFRESAFEVEVSHSGEEVLEKLRSGYAPDVLLLDIVMPAIDGFEVLKMIKKENLLPSALLIVLTNLGQKEDVEKGLRLGATDYIVKANYTPSEVVKKINDLFEKK
ncbi:response regulator [Candidatus Giovannonibacteria bacterium]|nr:response regulator [Candidatus Giovannonibacteria bacterium]